MQPRNAGSEWPRSKKAQGRFLAEQLRSEHELAMGPLDHIEQLTELVDADLLITPLPDKVDALTVRDPDTGHIVIGIATSKVPYRQNFSLAHEVGHIVAGDLEQPSVVNPCLNHDAETRANSFAAHILCPLPSLPSQLEGRDPDTDEAVSHLVQRYKVSPRVVVTQLKRAGLISTEKASALGRRWSTPRLASRFGWKELYDLEVQRASTPRPAPRLVADATQAYLDGLVSAEAVALARGISPQQVRTELDGFIETPPMIAPPEDPLAALNDFFGGD
mgnify:CR=1 FL=1